MAAVKATDGNLLAWNVGQAFLDWTETRSPSDAKRCRRRAVRLMQFAWGPTFGQRRTGPAYPGWFGLAVATLEAIGDRNAVRRFLAQVQS